MAAWLSAFAAVPEIIKLAMQFLSMFKEKPEDKIIKIGQAFKKLADAKEAKDYDDAAKEIAEHLRG